MQEVTLNNGVSIPILGFGVFQIPAAETKQAVLDAIEAGYRHFDTAQAYANEREVGQAIAESGLPREEFFITSKVWLDHYGYEKARQSVLDSLEKMGMDYLDLMLLHQPFSDYYGAYRALEDLYREANFGLSGSAISIWTALVIWQPLLKLHLRLTRLKLILLTSKSLLRKTW